MSQRWSAIFCATGAWGGKPIGRVKVKFTTPFDRSGHDLALRGDPSQWGWFILYDFAPLEYQNKPLLLYIQDWGSKISHPGYVRCFEKLLNARKKKLKKNFHFYFVIVPIFSNRSFILQGVAFFVSGVVFLKKQNKLTLTVVKNFQRR